MVTSATTCTTHTERLMSDYIDMMFAIRCLELDLPRRLRCEAGVTQIELAQRVETYQVYIHRWESGVKRPDLRDLDRLARYGRELRRLAEETGIINELSIEERS